MKLIVGLGNPGKEYENTRHNLGFLVLDKLADMHNLTFKKQCNGLVAKETIDGEKIVFAKPQTFMNKSGLCVKELMDYYDISIDDVLIVVDDKDQLTGNYKVVKTSGHGGQNGLRDIINQLGSNEFKRLKVGIGSERMGDTADYVLSNWNSEQKKTIQNLLDKFGEIAMASTKLNFVELTNKYNGK